MMRLLQFVRSAALFCSLLFFPGLLDAQEAPSGYGGFRAALFSFQLVSVKNNSAVVKCRIANTGRNPIGASRTAAQTVVELDTMNLPPVLWGYEALLAEAAKNNLPQLNPGEMSMPVWLSVRPQLPAATPGNSLACVDIQLEAASLRKMDNDKILASVVIRNAGAHPALIAGDEGGLGLNYYFVRGAKLTRGAIQAGSQRISIGKETLNGWLMPKQKIQLELEVNLTNRTKFSPNLLFELAIPSNLQDCIPGNNTAVLLTELLDEGM